MKMSELSERLQLALGSAGARLTNKDVENMSPEEIFDEWLEWEGIFGHGPKILEVVRELGLGAEK